MVLNRFNRREFMAGAGALFANSLVPRAAEAVDRSEVLLASATKNHDGTFSAVLLSQEKAVLKEIALPTRGHDVVFHPQKPLAVVFARRPGTFALTFPTGGSEKPLTIASNPGRHFYGHGVFSLDGKLLYATENAFEEAEGKIGIYDATENFKHIGEFDTGGIGPHEMLLMPDGKTLLIANGGIETHPDFGRQKLNLSTMESSFVFLNRETGEIVERHSLPQNLFQLSLRHMDVSLKGEVVFGGQYEGPENDIVPLVGKLQMGDELQLFDFGGKVTSGLNNYIGSVAISKDGDRTIVTAPRGDRVLHFNVKTGEVLQLDQIKGAFGAAFASGKPSISTDDGYLGNKQFADWDFDNHLARYG